MCDHCNVEDSISLKSLVNTSRFVLHAVKCFGIDTESWDPILYYLLLSKIDKESRHLWELNDDPISFKKIEEFFVFLEKQAHIRRDEYNSNHLEVHQLSKKMTDVYTVYKCQRCGTKHKWRNCPAWGKMCTKCKGMNHFAAVCKANQKQLGDSKEEKEVGIVERFCINELGDERTHCWLQDVIIENKHVSFKIDTGADVSVIPKCLAATLNAVIVKSNCSAVTYTGDKIPLLGSTKLKCVIGSKCLLVDFVVVDVNKTPLLGLQDCIRFDIIKRICDINTEVSIVSKNNDVFEGVGRFPFVHSIKLDSTFQPFVENTRRVPYSLHDKLKLKLEQMEEKGIIKKVTYPTEVVNPVVIVEKQNGDLRLCLDLRKLNKYVMREQFVIPTIDDITMSLQGKTVFTVLDLKDGYYHIELDESSADLCTFSTIFGRYRFQRLPFGLKSAPELFQRHVSRLFGDIPGVSIYFDDLLVSGATEKEHDETLEKVFDRARKYNVRFNASKIQYKRNTVKYLGQIFSEEGISVDDKYVEAIKCLPHPKNKNDVLRVLGIVKYVSKFVPNLSEISEPLRELTKNDSYWKWEGEEEESFNTIKSAVTNAPILAYFDPNKRSEIHVDASDGGLGACLFQDGRPVAFASRSLTLTERRYAIIEKELLAVHFGTKKFHHFIYGKKFVIKSDHKPLISICDKDINKLSPRLQRIRLKLLNYEFEIHYIPGREMLVPDALSRLQLDSCEPVSNLDFVVHAFLRSIPISERQKENLLKAMAEDTDMTKLAQFVTTGWPKKVEGELARYPRDELTICQGLIVWDNRIVVPQALRREMLEILHSSHAGIEKSKERAKQTIIWPQINKDIEDFISKCVSCQRFARKNQKQPIINHPLPIRPWQRLFADIMTYEAKDYLVVVDSYSNWIELIAIKQKSAKEVINHLKSLFSKFGIPESVVCDNIPFSSVDLQAFSRDYCFDIVTRSPNYAQSNSFAERGVGIMKNILKKTTEEKGDIYLALLEYRNTPLKYLKLSPSQLLMNRICRTKLPSTAEKLMPKVNERVPELLERKQNEANKYYNRSTKELKELMPDDLVAIEYPNDGKWHFGVVLKKHDLTPRSYIVKDYETGRVVRRNRRQLRVRGNDSSSQTQSPRGAPTQSSAAQEGGRKRDRIMPRRFKDYVC